MTKLVDNRKPKYRTIGHCKVFWFLNICQNVRKLTTIRTFWQIEKTF